MPVSLLHPLAAAIALVSHAPQGGAANAFNPQIAVVGDFQVRLKDPDKDEERGRVREVEIGLAAAADPHVKVEVYLGVEPEGDETHLHVEEAFGRYDALGGGWSGKFGKIAGAVGRTNRNHRDQLAFIEYPLALSDVWGEEGLRGAGGSLSYLVPGERFLDVTLEAIDPEDGPFFAGSRASNPVWIGHARTFFDFSEDLSAQWGLTVANGPTMAGRGTVVGTDFTMKWQPGKQGRSLLFEAEATWADRAAPGAPRTFGVFANASVELTRGWHAGVRYDSSEIPGGTDVRTGWTANLTRKVTEFHHWRLEYSRVASNFEDTRSFLTLQFQWVIGAHPAHKY